MMSLEGHADATYSFPNLDDHDRLRGRGGFYGSIHGCDALT